MWWKVKKLMPSGSAMSFSGSAMPESAAMAAKKFQYLKTPSTGRFAAIAA